MALKPVIESLDGLPDALKAEYKAGEGDFEGKFVLDVTPVEGLELTNTSGLKSALQKERSNVKSLQKKYQGLDDLVENADKAREALQRLEEMEEGATGDDKKQIETLKEQLKSQFEKDREKLQQKYDTDIQSLSEKNSKLSSQLQRALVEDKALSAINEAGGNARLLLPHVISQLRTVEKDDGEFAVEVLDPKNPEVGRLSTKSGSTDPMSINELIKEMQDSRDYAPCFPGSGGSGSGATGGANAGSGNSFSITAADARDPHKYRAAKEAAQKAGGELQVTEE